jgi:hypothetical protein
MDVHSMACDVHYLQPRSHLGCAQLGITSALRAYTWYEGLCPARERAVPFCSGGTGRWDRMQQSPVARNRPHTHSRNRMQQFRVGSSAAGSLLLPAEVASVRAVERDSRGNGHACVPFLLSWEAPQCGHLRI